MALVALNGLLESRHGDLVNAFKREIPRLVKLAVRPTELVLIVPNDLLPFPLDISEPRFVLRSESLLKQPRLLLSQAWLGAAFSVGVEVGVLGELLDDILGLAEVLSAIVALALCPHQAVLVLSLLPPELRLLVREALAQLGHKALVAVQLVG